MTVRTDFMASSGSAADVPMQSLVVPPSLLLPQKGKAVASVHMAQRAAKMTGHLTKKTLLLRLFFL